MPSIEDVTVNTLAEIFENPRWNDAEKLRALLREIASIAIGHCLPANDRLRWISLLARAGDPRAVFVDPTKGAFRRYKRGWARQKRQERKQVA